MVNKSVKSNSQTKITKSRSTTKIVSSRSTAVDVDTSRFKYNQIPIETPDASIKTFTIPNSESFVSGLLEVFVNGNQKLKGTEWEETGTTQFTFIGSLNTSPPESDESITMNYIKT